jgi:antagonist of KipI
MSITLLSNGILTTVQDLGRHGARRFGINPGGAMDTKAVRLINILLGNDENEAVLEMHFPAPRIRFEKAAVFALGGAEFGAKLDEQDAQNWRPHFAEKGSVLSFANKKMGARCYLSVKGGFAIEKWLGSAATNLKAQAGGFHGRALRKDDVLSFNSKLKIKNSEFGFRISPSLIPIYSPFPTVRVIAGAEFEMLTPEARASFTTQNFTVGLQSDRMGFRLEGESLKLEKPHEFISSAVGFGTVQLLPDEQLIVLMADHQTTGGYPRLAHIISEDLPLVGQLGAKDGTGFQMVSIEEAERLMIETEKELNFLRFGVRQKLM